MGLHKDALVLSKVIHNVGALRFLSIRLTHFDVIQLLLKT